MGSDVRKFPWMLLLQLVQWRAWPFPDSVSSRSATGGGGGGAAVPENATRLASRQTLLLEIISGLVAAIGQQCTLSKTAANRLSAQRLR